MNFQDFVKEDRIRRYVEYKAEQDKVPFNEAARRSLARVFDLITNYPDSPFVILTAFRGEKTLVANRAANRLMENDLRELGWGYIPVLGGYVEKVRDEDGNETGETKKIDSEESYFCVGNGDIKKDVLNLLAKYQQEAAIIRPAGSPDAILISANGSETVVGKFTPNQLADYFTKMRKGPPGRQFSFEAAGDSSRTTQMAVDKFFED